MKYFKKNKLKIQNIMKESIRVFNKKARNY